MQHQFLRPVAMSKRCSRFPSSIILFLLLQQILFIASRAQRNANCVPSTCGNIQEIKYPFRLQTDPQNCGDPSFILECIKNEAYISRNSTAFLVQSITYSNYSIRVVDPVLATPNKSCISIPSHYIGYDQFSSNIDDFKPFNKDVAFISCDYPFTSPGFFESPICGKSANSSQVLYSYVATGNDLNVSDMGESCSIIMVASGSAYGPLNSSTSLDEIKNGLAYGFEVSWYERLCSFCILVNGVCDLDGGQFCQTEDVPDLPVNPWIVIGVVPGILFAIFVPGLVYLVVYQHRHKHLAMDQRIEDFLRNQNMVGLINYSSHEIKKITNNFRDKHGQGAYGTVYKGKLQSGQYVAVKITSKILGSEEEFINEVVSIGRIHHVNVVQLVGFCVQGSVRALVYDFMANGSLDKYISRTDEGEEKGIGLNYKMYEISLGVAKGIDYLHRGCDMQILHFDIKPHNILLDENFNPKISDFGLAKLYPVDQSFVSLTGARGTMGYMAPELFYKNIGGISYKADVYSFGMLLMEIAARRKTVSPIEEHLTQAYFPTWIYDQLSRGKEIELVDDGEDREKEMVKKMILVALWCIQMSPRDRPAMNKVVEMLEGDVGALEMPPRPFLSPRGIAEDHGVALLKSSSRRGS